MNYSSDSNSIHVPNRLFKTAIGITFSLLVILGSTQARADYVSTVLADNPTVYWQFNESAGPTMFDSSGNGNNGQYWNPPTFSEPGAVVGGGTSIRLNGLTNYASDVFSFDSNEGQSFTAEVWVKSAVSDWDAYGWFASERSQNGFIMHPQVGTTLWTGYVYDNAGVIHTVGSYDVGDITEFHHYALSYDHVSDIGKMYVDGDLKVTTPNLLGSASRVNGAALNLQVGRDDFTNDGLRYGNGWMDEMAIYGTALTDAQLANHFAAAAIPEPSFVLLLPLGMMLVSMRRRRSIV